ncbi:MAG: 2Fe-2S iron-sulfur cluster-binding protein [Anaerolineae bacterium]
MAKIFIDDKLYEVEDGQNLLHACLSLGLSLPYFCWHPAMGSVGACRQCAVKQFKDENDTRGRIVMACMTPVTDGLRVSIEDPEAREFRASVIEWLMVNHPHDCPICDEGGECHLQDMTVMTGHDYREFRFKKRTHRNQYLGPFINHEMNRCIACYRCVRFYREYAGGRDFNVFAAHDYVYFGRHEDGVLENEFSGNLVEVCPTGVFTDKTLKQHYTRKWDLQTAPSICVHCSVGCNTIPGERYGTLRRIRNRYNHEVNGYFLCDRGRYGYEFVNSERRVRQPLLRKESQGSGEPITQEAALQQVASLLTNGDRVIGIGLVLGEDVTNTAPMLALALRQSVRRQPMAIAAKQHIHEWDDAAVREAVQQEKGPLFIGTPNSTRLDDVATKTYRAAPDDLARLGFAVAHALDPKAPAVTDLPDEVRTLAEDIAHDLKEAERPLVVSGTSLGSAAVMQAAANVAWALCDNNRAAELCLAVPESNSLGLGLMDGGSLEAAFEALKSVTADTVVILENDLYRRAGAQSVDTALDAARHVIAIDHLVNATTAKANVVLPAATFAEGDGTLVNNEGRAQRLYQVFVPEGDIQESWRWLRDIMVASGQSEASAWRTLDDITAALARALPVFEATPEIAPPAGFRVAGQKIPRQSPRYSGRTAMRANIEVSEPKPPEDPDSPLSFSMEGYEGEPPAALIPRFWAPGWNSIQAVNRFQEEVAGLIEPARAAKIDDFDQIPAAFEPREGEWLIIPIHHIFGSEELSILTPGIAELAPQPYLMLNPNQAADPPMKEGEAAELNINGTVYRLPVKFTPTLPVGIAGVPVGLPELPGMVRATEYVRISA